MPSPSSIHYVEIPAPNLEATGAFYCELFGWKVTPSSLTDKPYWMFSTGEGQLEGGFEPARSVHSGGGVLLYMKVADMDPVLAKVGSLGGVIVREKFAIGGNYGFSAVLADPSGNHIGLLSSH